MAGNDHFPGVTASPEAAHAIAKAIDHLLEDARRNGLKVPPRLAAELQRAREFLTGAATARQETTILAGPPPVPDAPDALLLSIEEGASRLGTSKRTVERLVSSGQLPSVLVGARSRRIRRADLEAYVAQLDT